MATPRSELVDANIPFTYHIITRCVRRSYLCGKDKATGEDYSYRKDWIVEGIEHLAPNFPIEVYSHAVMSNHFHIVLYFDPTEHLRWSNEEIADRWCNISPRKKRDGSIDAVATAIQHARLLVDEKLRNHKRDQLGSLSTFMKFLKQPIACQINREDGCTGHAFEQRFYSGVLLSEESMIAAMAYVDLNPVRAKLAKNIQEIDHASISQRMAALENSPERIEAELAKCVEPLVSGLPKPATPRLSITLKEYIRRLEDLISYDVNRTSERPPVSTKVRRWVEQVQSLAHRQRAYGASHLIESWITARGMQLREIPLPG